MRDRSTSETAQRSRPLNDPIETAQPHNLPFLPLVILHLARCSITNHRKGRRRRPLNQLRPTAALLTSTDTVPETLPLNLCDTTDGRTTDDRRPTTDGPTDRRTDGRTTDYTRSELGGTRSVGPPEFMPKCMPVVAEAKYACCLTFYPDFDGWRRRTVSVTRQLGSRCYVTDVFFCVICLCTRVIS